MSVLDRINRKILYYLDGGISPGQIAKYLRISRDMLYYRIRRMEEEGIIKKYITVIDYMKLGYSMGAFYFKYKRDNKKIKDEIIEHFVKMKEGWWVDGMRGYYDLGVALMTREGIFGIRKLQKEFYSKYREFIESAKFRIYVEFTHLRRSHLGDWKNETIKERIIANIVNKPLNISLDPVDEKILKYISENGKAPLREISTNIGVDASTIYRRIKKMKEKGIIRLVRPMIDLEKIGYRWYKLDIYLDNYKDYKKIKDFLFSHPNVVYFYDVLGGADLEVDVEIESDEKMEELSYALKNIFPTIAYTEFYPFTTEYKLTYVPPF